VQVVIAQHGAALANILWMRPQSVIVEIGRYERFQKFPEKLLRA
jgi:capsular polysaccharide biosynthesis protein